MALFNLKKVRVQTYSIQFVGYSMHLTRGNGGRHFGAGQVHVSHLFSFSFEFFLTRKVVILHDGVCIVQLASWDGLPLPLRQFYLSFNIVFSIFRFVVTHVASRWRWRRRGSIDGVTGVAVTASRLPPPPTPFPPVTRSCAFAYRAGDRYQQRHLWSQLSITLPSNQSAPHPVPLTISIISINQPANESM